MIGGCDGPGHRQFTRRIHLTSEQVGNRVTTFHTGLPSAENGIWIAAPRGCLNDTARVDDDDDGFACSVEGVANVHDQGALLRNEVELSVDIAVDTLASLTSNGDDGGVCCIYLVINGDGRDGNLRILLLAEVLHLIPLGGMALGLEFRLGKIDVLTIDVGKNGR